ncbi:MULTISPECIES: ACP S-malonyltransferase [unclassified Clostridium]|uniref:ACP S-malonyltransferase n=1 Tax=unclassified Clostridium TaxID=2614128 RepID=UPI0011074B65|nr:MULTISPECIES: ACP S-malonyltransferase [unclassified Clostridium]
MGKIAFVFAGQGAQYTGMGQSLYACSPAAKEVFDRAEAIRPGTIRQCFEGDKETLGQTINTQPCLFTVDYACAAAAKEAGISPQGAAGFSLGEVAAVAYCGVLDFKAAFRLVCRRAELMDDCAKQNPGAMAAILRLTPEQVTDACEGFDAVFPVNYNSPQQTVVSGSAQQLEAYIEKVTALGGRAMKLPVSGGFHSPFMAQAAKGLASYMAELEMAEPALPLYANYDAAPYCAARAKELLALQVQSPVRWQKTVENMVAEGFDTFVEVGAGKTLCGLIRKIAPQVQVYQVENEQTLLAAGQALAGGERC